VNQEPWQALLRIKHDFCAAHLALDLHQSKFCDIAYRVLDQEMSPCLTGCGDKEFRPRQSSSLTNACAYDFGDNVMFNVHTLRLIQG